MKQKYSLDEIKENLENLKIKLEDKGRDNGFWVVATRSDFKPIKIEETIKGKTKVRTLVKLTEVKNDLLEGKEQYFKNKKLAFIEFWFNSFLYSDTKKYSEKNYDKIKDEVVFSIIISINVLDDDGKLNNKPQNSWECKINFTVDDLSKLKIKFAYTESLMRHVADKLVTTEGFWGINYKDYKKIVIKKLKK